MKPEFWMVFSLGVFFVVVTPTYWLLTGEVTGSVALLMTMLFCIMLTMYLGFVVRAIPARPEDRKDGEIIEGAGELGFFPPYSWWPLWSALVFATLVVGVVVGWWMVLLAVPLVGIVVCGWVFEYYRGIHAH